FGSEGAYSLVLRTHPLDQLPPRAGFRPLMPVQSTIEKEDRVGLGRGGCRRLSRKLLDWKKCSMSDRADRSLRRKAVRQKDGSRNVIAWVNPQDFPNRHFAPPEVCATALSFGNCGAKSACSRKCRGTKEATAVDVQLCRHAQCRPSGRLTTVRQWSWGGA